MKNLKEQVDEIVKSSTPKAVKSPYQIIWAEFFPAYGIVTKHDRRKFGDISLSGRKMTYRKHFESKTAALDYIHTFNKKLNKSYIVRLFTDKQFSLAKESNGYAIPYTKKQYDEIYKIGFPKTFA